MLHRFIALVLLLCGFALIVDYFAPPRRQASVVESLSSWTDMEGETVYAVALSGGALAECHVDSNAHERLQRGDRVEVEAGHLFDSCIRIVRGEDTLYRTRAQPFVALLLGVSLVALVSLASFGRFRRRAG